MSQKNSVRNMIVHFIENVFAYALPVFFQQFIVYPLMAGKLGAEANGRFLAAIALNYFVVNLTSAVLVNVRLLRNEEYEKKNLRGDFNLFLLAFAAVNSLVIIGGTIFYAEGAVSLREILLSVIVVLLFTYHDYILVQYRVELRFREILVNNLLLCVGYLAGVAALYYVLPCWQVVFIVPYLITTVYDYTHTDYIREPLHRTELFAGTSQKYLVLLGSTLLTTVVTYGDRLLLLPLLDGTSVSVFSSAQLIGKMLQMISTPISSFMLAYLVRNQARKIGIRLSWPVIGAGICAVCYGACVLISGPLIRFLYPLWAEQSLQYVKLTAANGVLHMVNILLNVIVLRYCSARWQIVKSAAYMVTYLGFSFLLLRWYGLTGFCIGNILASVSELVLLSAALLWERVFTLAGDR